MVNEILLDFHGLHGYCLLFGMHKTYGLPEDCLDCSYIRLCFGGCPKDRLWGGKNYLCDGYRSFFGHMENLENIQGFAATLRSLP